MSNDAWVTIAAIAFSLASIPDAISSVRMSRYGVRELFPQNWSFWKKGQRKTFSLISYVISNFALLFILLRYSYPYPPYQNQTIAGLFILTGLKLLTGFILNPYLLKKAKGRSGRIAHRLGGLL